MKIGIAIFAYNRSYHLQRVLDGLKQNDRVGNIYIFQDGLKCEEDDLEWKKTKEVIDNINWCDVAITVQTENIGLADSIISGVDKVLQENDAVIVLEDDCVPHPDFTRFMVQCFEKYERKSLVYSISGYSWTDEIVQEENVDNYFCGRISSWGWGTWKNRWLEYKRDYALLNRIKRDRRKAEYLATWGNDLEKMLIGNLQGKINSWAVFWALTVIEKEGLCVNPYKSLIQNIGMDGTGVHCGVTDKYQVCLSEKRKEKFVLTDNYACNNSLKNNFIYGNPLVQKPKDIDFRKKIIVYGIGRSFEENARVLGKKYQVKGLIDKKKKGIVAGYEIKKPKMIKEYEYDYIIIMNKNFELALQIAQELITKYDVDCMKVKLGCLLFETEGIEDHHVLNNQKCEVVIGKIRIIIDSNSKLQEVEQIFINKIYDFYIGKSKENTAIIVGHETGILEYYFRGMNDVKKIYAIDTREPENSLSVLEEDISEKKIIFIDCTEKIPICLKNKLKQMENAELFIIRTRDERMKKILQEHALHFTMTKTDKKEYIFFVWMF